MKLNSVRDVHVEILVTQTAWCLPRGWSFTKSTTLVTRNFNPGKCFCNSSTAARASGRSWDLSGAQCYS